MREVIPTDDLLQIAYRMVWFKAPEETIRDAVFFLSYALTYGMHKDLKVVRKYVNDDDLREALEKAHPGIFDSRSWSYWHLILSIDPVPPLPTRRFPEGPINTE